MADELRAFLDLATLPAVSAVCAVGALLVIKSMLTPPEARRVGEVVDLIKVAGGGMVLGMLALAVVFGVVLGFGVSWAEIAAG